MSSRPVTNQVNAGGYVFPREVIEEIPPGAVVSVERQTFPALIADDAVVMSYLHSSSWLDGGTPEAFVQGSCDLVLARGARIGESVVLDGAVIGEDVSVASGSELRAGMRVWPGVDLGPASVRFSTDV